ncbi:hypothetical protein ACSTAY_12875 [Vreelandella alkaliphila]|uniref:PBP domain-containing protein n=1 Tax=Vreelandella alkaliphila TaxID=272774 RepID=A0AAJ2VPN6_9GAMM|nr:MULTISPECIES: hypothetical protein [Halomonas]MCD6004543.1 hypothetical protein [Halomonas sp. IOP_6]MDX5976904.1 hypothetical protein [Halomonas alkaliphila]
MLHGLGVQQAMDKTRAMPSLYLIRIACQQITRGLIGLVLAFLLAEQTHAQSVDQDATILLVAHPAVATQWLNRDTTRAIFAMRQRTWPDGEAVQVFVLPNRDPVHARFTKEQLAVYPHQLQLAWDRMVFSGMGQAPNRVADQLEMREKIANTPGALGYLEREYLDENVQVISME